MLCYPTDLVNFDPCRYGLNAFVGEVVKTQMLCNWKNQLLGGDYTCDIQGLLDDAKCFFTLQPFVLKVIQLQILCDILDLYTNPPVISPEIDQTTGTQDVDSETGQPVFDRG